MAIMQDDDRALNLLCVIVILLHRSGMFAGCTVPEGSFLSNIE
jgi:hypothetical protein